MNANLFRDLALFFCAIPFIYYSIALFSAWRFFQGNASTQGSGASNFTPPVSILKPVRGLDPEAYENFASFCTQDYSAYEIIFCAGDRSDPIVPVIEKLIADFPASAIRLIYSDGHTATNDKVAKLSRLVNEARHDVLVINDSDVRVRPDYLRTVVSPLQDKRVGAVTCFYASLSDTTFTQNLQSIGMLSDFYAGILVSWQLDGVKFTLGPTIATTRKHLQAFGGYPVLENRPADDLLVGRFIAEQGYEVRLLSYTVQTVADFQSTSDLLHKRLRWMTVMRHMRPWGHVGLIFTQGLVWSLAAVMIHPTVEVAVCFLGAYAFFRGAMTWLIAIHGLEQRSAWKKVPLIPIWDALAFMIWIFSFGRNSIRWRDVDYQIREGMLVPTTTEK